MLATFALRLACGLIGSLLLLSPALSNPRFYRTHFLTALGLAALAAVFLRGEAQTALWLALGAALVLTFAGSLAWSIAGAPGGRSLVFLAAVSLIAALGLNPVPGSSRISPWLFANELSSAALLGSATTAMLMGHSYLIAPSMSLVPLFRLIGLLLGSVLIRGAMAGITLASWTAEHSLFKLNDVTMLLPLRWGMGVVAPLVLGLMAWQTTRIRSTQSATGILYVVVIFCFLGELFSLLLYRFSGLVL